MAATTLAETFTVGNTAVRVDQPTAIHTGTVDVLSVLILNNDSVVTLYVGGPGITAGTGAVTDGLPIKAGQSHSVTAPEGDSLGPVYVRAPSNISVPVEFLVGNP